MCFTFSLSKEKETEASGSCEDSFNERSKPKTSPLPQPSYVKGKSGWEVWGQDSEVGPVGFRSAIWQQCSQAVTIRQPPVSAASRFSCFAATDIQSLLLPPLLSSSCCWLCSPWPPFCHADPHIPAHNHPVVPDAQQDRGWHPRPHRGGLQREPLANLDAKELHKARSL